MALAKQGSVALLMAVFMFCAQSAQAAETRVHVGDVERLQELASAVFRDKDRTLSSGAPLLFGDLLRTGADARLKGKLVDGAELTMGENAELLVDEFVYEPDGNEGRLTIKVLQGAFMFVGGKIEEKANSGVRIETSFGVLGVRGTTVWGGAIDDGWGVLVLDGQVTVTTSGGAVTVNAGQGTMIYENEPTPSQPSSWSEAKTARAVAAISFRE